MNTKSKLALCLASLATVVSCNICAAQSFTIANTEPKMVFLYMNELEKSFFKPNAYNVMFQVNKYDNMLIVADSESKNIFMVLKPYENTGVAYDIIELPVTEPDSGLFAISATAGAHAQNLGYWLLGVNKGKWKVYVDYAKLQQNGFHPEEWNRLYGKYDEYNNCFAITNTTEYMPPWGKISADLIDWPKAKWGCIWNKKTKSFDLQRLETERVTFITDQYQAMVYIESFIKNSPRFRHLLNGAQLSYSCQNPDGSDGLETHEIKVIEDHPTHIVTRATFRTNEIGDVYYYDVVNNKLEKVK